MEDKLEKSLEESEKVVEEKPKKSKIKIFPVVCIVLGLLFGILIGYFLPPCAAKEYLYQMTGIDLIGSSQRDVVRKPVIYVYGDEGQEVTVSVIPSEGNKLICTYPKISTDNSWTVKCEDENMLSIDGYTQQFNYLYWEGMNGEPYSIESGFCVKGEDSGKFLNESLHTLGLDYREANEFIVYWLPILESNEYNLISFDNSEYQKDYELKTEPIADNVLRVYMTFKGLDEPVDVESQDLTEIRGDFERDGLTIVEWGGSELNEHK